MRSHFNLKGDEMKEGFILLSRSIPWLGILCWVGLVLPDPGRAAWPSQAHAAVQPVLVTALALTSLVLFLIYVFTRKQATTKTTRARGKKRRRETVRVLEQIFDQHHLAMVKLSLDGTRILDATPSLLQALGVEKEAVLRQNSGAAGLVPEDMQHLMARGFRDTRVPLFNKASGDWENCRVLNIVCRSGEPPFIMGIVSGLSGKSSPDSLPGCINDILDNRTLTQ